MLQKIFTVLTNPNNPNFWQAMTFIVTLVLVIESIASRISKKHLNKTTRILIKTIVEQYLEWVKVESQSQKVNNESIKTWVVENGGGIKTERNYLVFRKVIKELKKGDFRDLLMPDENTYEIWVSKYDGATKWGRKEW